MNKIAIVFICAAIPFMISIYIANLKVLTLIVPFIILFFIATVFLNKFGKFTTSKLVLFCLYIPKSDYSSVGTTYSTVSFNPHLHPNFVQAATTAAPTTTYFHYNFLSLPELPLYSNGSNGHDGFH